MKGDDWYIRFSEWRQLRGGRFGYAETERKIDTGGAKVNKKRAEMLGYEQWVSKANQTNSAPQGKMTLEFFTDNRFVPDVVDQHFGRVWKNSAMSILKVHILPRFGAMQIGDIRNSMVQEWVSSKSKSGLAPGTVKKCLNILRQILDHAAGMDIDVMNTRAKIRLPKLTYTERTAYTMDQIRQLADVLRLENKHDYARFCLFLSLTGMRRGEALAMRWTDVDFDAGFARVRGTWDGQELTPGKSRKAQRDVPLVPEAISILREQLAGSKWKGIEHPVFAADRGSKPRPFNAANALKRHVKPAAVKLGMAAFDWHSERHTMATKLDGVATSAEKMAILGHSSPGMTNRYTHLDREALKDAMNRAEGGLVN